MTKCRWLAPEIAQSLAAAMMEAEATCIGEEQSLAWIRPIADTSTWKAARNLSRVSPPGTPMTAADIACLNAIVERISVIEAEMEDEALSEDAYTALSGEVDVLETERSEISRRRPPRGRGTRPRRARSGPRYAPARSEKASQFTVALVIFCISPEALEVEHGVGTLLEGFASRNAGPLGKLSHSSSENRSRSLNSSPAGKLSMISIAVATTCSVN